MKQQNLPDQITVRCCACAGMVTFQVPRPDPNDRPTFFHTIPACKRFDDTNTPEGVVQYLRDCGDARERK